ncbi:diaminopimelate decarboxylase family protein [Sphaerospermopsis torques-reginae]|uniref:Decarboxylase n=1 Tax=Sphaerospermopsis torques-reginae ITEP-024 TaxID=984208 RepID=A0ABX8WZ66_9CYAN|nr:decarboxylase [Sphaerospermopsis torques-reginae]QYX31694.1 decarboxylase [Sphaerospermopsis torques-reginae ITEP-024]
METLQETAKLLTPFSQELAEELLNIYGSPLYVYDGDILNQTISHITNSFHYPQTRFYFASVTNGNIALLKIFKNAGWGLHANTPGDIYLGLNAGFAPSEIVYSGSNLSREEMEQVLNWGVNTLNLDSISQLRLLCEIFLFRAKTQRSKDAKLNIGLRLNISEDSRIGVSIADFDEAVAIASNAGLKISGLHFYRGTGTNATSAFTNVIDEVISIAENLPDWQYLDFGGGFGFPYHHDGVAFDWETFGDELSRKIGNLGKNINLIIEPGRSAIAGCGTLLAQVVSVKWQGNKQVLGVDSTVANLSVPAVHGGFREIVSWKNQTYEKNITNYITDVCGNTTYSRDYLGKNCQLPALKIGDMIAILDVGAYGYAMSSHFLHRPKPAEVLIENGTHRLIRKREDYSVLLNNQIV